MSNLGQIRANVRINLGETTQRFYTQPELNAYISEAFKHYSVEENEQGEGMFGEKVLLPITANVETVDLGSLSKPFMSVIRLQKNVSTGTIPLIETPLRFTPSTYLSVGYGDSYLPKWYLRGNKIVLSPTPQNSETATLQQGLTLEYNYIPVFPTSVSPDSFVFDASFPTVYEPMIEIYATIAALETKDGMGGVSDIASFRERLAKWEKRFEDSLTRSEFPDQVQYMGVDYSNSYWRY